MCFRGGTPNRHYVCLPCRSSFKKRGTWASRCPRCGEDLIDAGQDLAVPKRRDTAGWRTLTALLNAGVTFHSGCCDGPGWRPRTPREVRERLAAAAGIGVPLSVALTTVDMDELRPGHTAR
ncbi:hypothetical protein PV343_03905 [Streptomyces sp. WI03-4A]|nr:hypothetical protein [Streptomyces sp. WI03-4A]